MTTPTPQELWLVRHGQTAANHARILQGQTDTDLDAVGRDQAAALARWIDAHDVIFDRVVSSPLARALQTGDPLAEVVGLDVETDPRLMERSFGVLEGTPADDAWALQDAFAGDPFDFKPEGGESAHEMSARVTAALESMRDAGRVLVVTHGGPIGAAVAHATGLPYGRDHLRRFRRDNTGLTVLESKPTRWVVTTLNARPHLW